MSVKTTQRVFCYSSLSSLILPLSGLPHNHLYPILFLARGTLILSRTRAHPSHFSSIKSIRKPQFFTSMSSALVRQSRFFSQQTLALYSPPPPYILSCREEYGSLLLAVELGLWLVLANRMLTKMMQAEVLNVLTGFGLILGASAVHYEKSHQQEIYEREMCVK